jgi:hypothetical protein
MTKHSRSRWLPVTAVLIASAVALAPAAARAQAGDAQVPVYRLDLRKVNDIPQGKAALVNGSASPTPQRFFVENLHMLMPVAVTLRAVNPADVVKLRVVKGKWEAPLREGSTAGGQQVHFRFRTQGEFQLQVDSTAQAAPYKLMVWVGPDIEPRLPAVFVPRSEFAGGRVPLWWWIAGGAVVLAGVVAFFIARRRKAS